MAYLFAWDFHGTLEKGNEYAVQRICETVLEKFGYYRRVTLDEVLYLYGQPWFVYFKTLVPSLTENQIKDMEEVAIQISKTHKFLEPMDYAIDVLLLLKLKGNENIVVSNTRQERLKNFLEATGVAPMITKFFGTEKSHEKTNFDPIKFKAETIMRYSKGRFDKIFMIGDTESDIEAGLLAGAQTILFNPRGNSVETRAHHIITDLREILKLI